MKKNNLIDILKVDYFLIISYLLTWTFILISYKNSYVEMKTINQLIQFASFLVPIILFITYFKRLRVLKVFLIWLAIALLQIVVLFPFKNLVEFKAERGSYLDSIFNLLIMLVMLFVFRTIYFFCFKQELIIITRFIDREREVNAVDYIFTMLGLIILSIICPIVFNGLSFF